MLDIASGEGETGTVMSASWEHKRCRNKALGRLCGSNRQWVKGTGNGQVSHFNYNDQRPRNSYEFHAIAVKLLGTFSFFRQRRGGSVTCHGLSRHAIWQAEHKLSAIDRPGLLSTGFVRDLGGLDFLSMPIGDPRVTAWTVSTAWTVLEQGLRDLYK